MLQNTLENHGIVRIIACMYVCMHVYIYIYIGISINIRFTREFPGILRILMQLPADAPGPPW